MRFDVLFTPAARTDIDDIRAYIAERDGQDRADRISDELERACSSLIDMPGRGNVPKELERAGGAGYRELHLRPYRIIYRVLGRRVVIFAVLDGRRDMQTLLRGRLLR